MGHEFIGDRAEPRIAQEIVIVIGPIPAGPRGRKERKRPPTTNESNRAIARAGVWRQRQEWRTHAKKAASGALLAWEDNHAATWSALERAQVIVEFIVPTKARRDLDNLIATMKPLLDGIVDAGVMVDDSTDVIGFMTFFTTYLKGETSTRIVVREPDE